MNILSLENITKAYASKVLFSDVNMGFDNEDRVGIVGINGTGKSTFLKILAGLEPVDSGKVTRTGGLTVRYLPQNPVFVESMTVLEQIYSGNDPIMKAIRDFEEVTLKLAHEPDRTDLQADMVRKSGEMDRLDAWNAETHAKNILWKLGVMDLDKKLGELSGGQRKRVAMAEAFIQPADMLILDEPTNHLDHDTIEWLEEYLKSRKGALVLVTHDRYFLNRVTNRTMEIDKGGVYAYDGNFEYFLEKKAMREEMNARSEEKRRRLYASELEWIRRGPQGRGTKQKARIQRFEALESGKAVDEAGMSISVAFTRMGKKCIELENVDKSFEGKQILKEVSYIVKPTERLAIVGPNGAGKSTLLNIIAGQLMADSGIVDVGDTVRVGYYTQENVDMDYDMRAIDYIKQTAEACETADGFRLTAAQMMERFLFDGNLQYSLIRHLSGGERRRLLLARILMEAPNVLLLDEPTNDLDIATLEILEEYLDYFRGAVIVVSHDRYFIDKTVDHLLAIGDDGKVALFNDLDSYRESVRSNVKNAVKETGKATGNLTGNVTSKAANGAAAASQSAAKLKFTFNEKREFEMIEGVIAGLEAELAAVVAEMEACQTEYGKLQELTARQEALEMEIMEKMDRWAVLSEMAEQIAQQNN